MSDVLAGKVNRSIIQAAGIDERRDAWVANAGQRAFPLFEPRHDGVRFVARPQNLQRDVLRRAGQRLREICDGIRVSASCAHQAIQYLGAEHRAAVVGEHQDDRLVLEIIAQPDGLPSLWGQAGRRANW